MSEYAQAGVAIELTYEDFPPNLTYPTIGGQVLSDADGSVTVPRTASSGHITQEPAGSGRYVWTVTVPAAGEYGAILDYTNGVLTPGSFASTDLVVSALPPTNPGGPPSQAERYVTLDELKLSLNLSGQSYADADILVALDAASRGLEDAYETFWVSPPASDVRYYTRSGVREVHLGDAVTISEVALDYSYSDLYNDGRVWDWDTGLGTYSSILDPAWYRLLPIQNGPAGNGEPYQTLQLTRASQRLILPTGQDAIRVTGTFGWTVVPSGVKTAVTMITARLVRRTREAPFGILSIGAEGAAIRARDIANDPDIRFAMGPATGTPSLFA